MFNEIIEAVLNDDFEKLESFIKQGGNLNEVSEKENWNLLHMALLSVTNPASSKMIKYLESHDVSVNLVDSYGNTPLHYASRSKHVELMEILLNAGCEIDHENNDGFTPLRLTIMSKPYNPGALELLLSHGANAEHSPAGGVTVKNYAEIILHGEDKFMLELFDKYIREDDGSNGGRLD